jgi:flagellar hook-associated protein 1 FlgK
MGTEFGTITSALSALQADRNALQVTGQNIANSSTDGYTRQRAVFQAVGGSVIPAMYSRSDGIGSGVTLSGIQRLQDAFLEQRANTENATLSNLQGVQSTLTDIENAFGEPGSSGLQSLLSSYWNSWDDVANNPSDPAARTSLIGAGQSVATALNTASDTLSAQWTSSRESLQATIEHVNATTANVAALNKAIVAATAAGNSPNDLMDQRDLLIRDLASSLGITTRSNTDGSTDVLLGGSSLVSGSQARQLTVTGATALDQVGVTPVSLNWSDTGLPAYGLSGQSGALLTAMNDSIPSYSAQLDDVAKQLVTNVNAQQVAGYDLNGDPGASFFDPTKTTAATITVTIADPSKVAASSQPPTLIPPVPPATTPTVQPSYDGTNAQAMANMSGNGADATYRTLIINLGSASRSAQQQVSTQQGVTQQVEQARDSAAGVDLDEEQTNLITYQHAYEAAARFLSVVDSVLDTLINKTLV